MKLNSQQVGNRNYRIYFALETRQPATQRRIHLPLCLWMETRPTSISQ